MSSWIAVNRSLTRDEMINNAGLLYQFLSGLGWDTKTKAATMGNIQWESGINPGRWEVGKDPYTPKAGYGLVQWTPYTKYSQWAGKDWERNGMKQCQRIEWEWRNNRQWVRHEPVSWDEYAYNTRDFGIAYLTEVWQNNYEVAERSHLQNRIDNAVRWYEWITGEVVDPDDPYPDPPEDPGVQPPSAFKGVILWSVWDMLNNNSRRTNRWVKV